MIEAMGDIGNNFTILQIDAHIDWREIHMNERYGLSSTMRRASEMKHIKKIIQVGSRGIGSAHSKDYRDAIPKKGLDTPEGRAIQAVLDERINPAVAGHGGHISLIDVKDDQAFIRLEGGCQGCGMADVTLKQGVEVEIKGAVPSISAVLDVTDHAGGNNPYYSPGKGGATPY